MKILSGAYAPDAGEVYIEGQKVEVFDPRVAQRMGVSIIYQDFNLIPYMNVAQNIFLGRFPMKIWADRSQEDACGRLRAVEQPEYARRHAHPDCRFEHGPATDG